MNNLNIIRISGLFILVILLAVCTSNVYSNNGEELYLKSSPTELNIEIQEIVNKLIPETDLNETNIELLDENFNTIAFGTESETRINSLLHKSDLITEIQRIKYFLIGYDNE